MWITDVELGTYYAYTSQPTTQGVMVVRAVSTSTKIPHEEDSTVLVEVTIAGKRHRFRVKPHELQPLPRDGQ